uniref:Uncharacterized protein n=1 Tax=Alexandrium catenella TaxID=2925 RepID=A0A7S1WUZ8_ALECA
MAFIVEEEPEEEPEDATGMQVAAAEGAIVVSTGQGEARPVRPEQIKFHMSCRDGDLEAVKRWLDGDQREQVDLDWSDSVGMTALMWVAQDGCVPVARALLEARADPTIADGMRPGAPFTALEYALAEFSNDDNDDDDDDEYYQEADEDDNRELRLEVAEIIRRYMPKEATAN